MLPLNACFDEFASFYYTALCTTVSVSTGQTWNKGTKATAHFLLNVKFAVNATTYSPEQNHSVTPITCIFFQE